MVVLERTMRTIRSGGGYTARAHDRSSQMVSSSPVPLPPLVFLSPRLNSTQLNFSDERRKTTSDIVIKINTN